MEGRPWPQILVLALGATMALGWVDILSGPEVSFSVFYLGPIAAAAWYAGPAAGIAACLAAAATWVAADRLSGHAYSIPGIVYWNGLVRLGYFLVVTRLLVALRRRLEVERALADTDGLTGLPNARAFLEALEAERLRAARYERPFTMAYADLDGFKAVNDLLGHGPGDEVLREVARAMAGAVRRTDVVARMGGDEFAVLLPETEGEAAERAVAKLRTAVESLAASRGWPLGVSVGSVTFRESPADAEAAVRAADELMYREKRARKAGGRDLSG